MKAPIICAGFHRSGTSLAAQQLHGLGFSYALEPMAGNLSNPDGHFEDIVAMQLHDRILEGGGTDWMYAGDSRLALLPNTIDELRQYAVVRKQVSGDVWVMKDPRATLMLHEWKQALNNEGRFVLLYRHWSLCVQSLLKRHSQDLAYFLPTGKALDNALVFWKDPTLAARMWLTYNQHLVDFAEQNPSDCLVVSQYDLMQGVHVADGLREKFKYDLNNDFPSCVNKAYAEESVDTNVLAMLPSDLVRQLDQMFERLERLNDSGLSTTIPKVVSVDASSEMEHFFADKIIKADQQSPLAVTESPVSHLLNEAKELAFDVLHKRLASLVASLSPSTAGEFRLIANQLLSKNELHFIGHEWLGRCAFVQRKYKEAEIHFLRAISFNPSPPYLRMLLGDVYRARLDYRKAEYYYLAAHSLNPANVGFTVKVAEMAMLLGQSGRAIEWYKKALIAADVDWIKVKYSNALSVIEGNGAALHYIASVRSVSESDQIEKLFLTKRLEMRQQGAIGAYHEYIKSKLDRQRISAFIVSLGQAKLPATAVSQLASWMVKAYLKIYTASELRSLLVIL